MSRFEQRFAPPELPHAKWVIATCAIIAALFLFLLLTGCASTGQWERAAIGAAALDVATTAYGLSQGGEEANPILSGDSDGEVIAKAAIFSFALHWAVNRLIERWSTESQMRTWRLVVSIRTSAAAWNLAEIGNQ